jgi:hypothetical protein
LRELEIASVFCLLDMKLDAESQLHVDIMYFILKQTTPNTTVALLYSTTMSSPSRIIETATVDAQPVVMVRVTAPSSLEGGYTFDAVYNGEVFPVTVPQGGVKAGQTFRVPFLPAVDAYAVAIGQPQESPTLQQQSSSEWTPMLPPQQQTQQQQPLPTPPNNHSNNIRSSSSTQQAPLGTWRTHWFDCLSEGLCHPSLCNAFWVPQILMGQVLTRMKLNCCGHRVGSDYKKSTCIWMFLTIAVMYARSRLQNCITITDPSNYSVWGNTLENILDDDIEIEHIRHHIQDAAAHAKDDIDSRNCTSDDAHLLQTITWLWFWMTVLVLARLRRAVRNEHGITRSFPFEDLVCSAFCHCCTVAQLARQTANYKEQRAYCCTNTGLAEGWFGHRQEELERRHVHGHHLVHAHGCDHSDDQNQNRNGEQIV